MILSIFALSLSLAAGPPSTLDVYGAEVSLKDSALLIVDPADRKELKDKLKVVRAHRARLSPKNATKSLVIVVNLSDVPSIFRGMAEDKIKARATEAAKRNPERSLSWIADKDGSLSKTLRGPLKGSCLVRTDAKGAHLRGTTVDELVKRAAAAKP